MRTSAATRSRSAGASPSSHSSSRTIEAPTGECPGWRIRPSSSMRVVAGLAMSCSRHAANTTSRSSAGSACQADSPTSASHTIFVCAQAIVRLSEGAGGQG